MTRRTAIPFIISLAYRVTIGDLVMAYNHMEKNKQASVEREYCFVEKERSNSFIQFFKNSDVLSRDSSCSMSVV